MNICLRRREFMAAFCGAGVAAGGERAAGRAHSADRRAHAGRRKRSLADRRSNARSLAYVHKRAHFPLLNIKSFF
jgi:hypothetical protein